MDNESDDRGNEKHERKTTVHSESNTENFELDEPQLATRMADRELGIVESSVSG